MSSLTAVKLDSCQPMPPVPAFNLISFNPLCLPPSLHSTRPRCVQIPYVSPPTFNLPAFIPSLRSTPYIPPPCVQPPFRSTPSPCVQPPALSFNLLAFTGPSFNPHLPAFNLPFVQPSHLPVLNLVEPPVLIPPLRSPPPVSTFTCGRWLTTV